MMDAFTQKLLERTQARKEALAQKRHDLIGQKTNSATLRETRGPLVKKDLNKNGANNEMSWDHPQTQLPCKRESSGKAQNRTGPLDKRQKEDAPDGRHATTDFGKRGSDRPASNTKVPCAGESIQQRMARLQNQNKKTEDSVLEIKRQRQWEMDKQKQVQTKNLKYEKDETEAKRLSASVGDKAALFETGTPISTNDIDRILGMRKKSSDAPKRDYENDSRYVKAYVDKSEINVDRMLGASNRCESAKKEEISQYNSIDKPESSSEIQRNLKARSLPVEDDIDDLTYVSDDASVSELVDSEQVDSDTDYESGDECSSNGESISDENAFDISGVLREANDAVGRQRHLLPDERQEFHVLSPYTETKSSQEDKPMSSFERMLFEKGQQVKSPCMVKRLDDLDKDTSTRSLQQVSLEQKVNLSDNSDSKFHSEAGKKFSTEGNAAKGKVANNLCDPEENQLMQAIENVMSPTSPVSGTVRDTSKSKKAARRSVSFSGSRPSPKVIFKSGYNEEQSAKYNVRSNIQEISQVQRNPSNHEKIQEFLEEAASQQNIVLQTSQALNLSYASTEDRRGSPEVVEGERFLLIATERRTACLEEVQRLKQLGDPFSRKTQQSDGSVPPCKATVTFSDVLLPLNQDFMMALRAGRMDLGIFHFVVIIQHGPLQLCATRSVSTYDELKGNSLAFKETLILENVPHDFTMNIKVFGMHTKRGVKRPANHSKSSKESPRLMRNMFSSLTPRRRANSEDSPGASSPQKTIFRNSSFTLVGEAKVNLSTIGAGRHVLAKVPSNSPLEGLIQLHAACVPEFSAKAAGFLTLFEDVGGYNALNRRWCVLQNNVISCWRYPDEENTKEPLGRIELKWCINKIVDLIRRDQCARPHTFEVVLKRPVNHDDKPSLQATIDGKYITIKQWLSADNKEDRVTWLETINKQLSDHRAWRIKESTAKRQYTMGKGSIRMSHRGQRQPTAV